MEKKKVSKKGAKLNLVSGDEFARTAMKNSTKLKKGEKESKNKREVGGTRGKKTEK